MATRAGSVGRRRARGDGNGSAAGEEGARGGGWGWGWTDDRPGRGAERAAGMLACRRPGSILVTPSGSGARRGGGSGGSQKRCSPASGGACDDRHRGHRQGAVASRGVGPVPPVVASPGGGVTGRRPVGATGATGWERTYINAAAVRPTRMPLATSAPEDGMVGWGVGWLSRTPPRVKNHPASKTRCNPGRRPL